MKIAVDSMGGDFAPEEIVKGAIEYSSFIDGKIILVGNKQEIEKYLDKEYENIEVYHSSQVVDMQDAPISSVRTKKDSSVNVAVKLVKDSKADAVVTAGNTGAAVCSATINLKVLPGVERPGIVTVLPNIKGGYSILIDAGANIQAKPSHLLQYAIMGSIYSKYILNCTKPKVGLLNIGEEETKGTNFLKETNKLLNTTNLDFIGNLEAGDVFKGVCDVIVCDGLVGNITLKVAEGFADAMTKLIKKYINEKFIYKIGAFLSKGAFKNLYREIDCTEYGGALLLGVQGICIICHGSSNANAIKNAIKVAAESVACNINNEIIKGIR